VARELRRLLGKDLVFKFLKECQRRSNEVSAEAYWLDDERREELRDEVKEAFTQRWKDHAAELGEGSAAAHSVEIAKEVIHDRLSNLPHGTKLSTSDLGYLVCKTRFIRAVARGESSEGGWRWAIAKATVELAPNDKIAGMMVSQGSDGKVFCGQSAAGKESESQIHKLLTEHGVSFVGENTLQMRELDRHIQADKDQKHYIEATPDFELEPPIEIRGQKIKWIEVKRTFTLPGASADKKVSKLYDQLQKYSERYAAEGAGIVVWTHCGFAGNLEPIPGVVHCSYDTRKQQKQMPKKTKPKPIRKPVRKSKAKKGGNVTALQRLLAEDLLKFVQKRNRPLKVTEMLEFYKKPLPYAPREIVGSGQGRIKLGRLLSMCFDNRWFQDHEWGLEIVDEVICLKNKASSAINPGMSRHFDLDLVLERDNNSSNGYEGGSRAPGFEFARALAAIEEARVRGLARQSGRSQASGGFGELGSHPGLFPGSRKVYRGFVNSGPGYRLGGSSDHQPSTSTMTPEELREKKRQERLKRFDVAAAMSKSEKLGNCGEEKCTVETIVTAEKAESTETGETAETAETAEAANPAQVAETSDMVNQRSLPVPDVHLALFGHGLPSRLDKHILSYMVRDRTIVRLLYVSKSWLLAVIDFVRYGLVFEHFSEVEDCLPTGFFEEGDQHNLCRQSIEASTTPVPVLEFLARIVQGPRYRTEWGGTITYNARKIFSLQMYSRWGISHLLWLARAEKTPVEFFEDRVEEHFDSLTYTCTVEVIFGKPGQKPQRRYFNLMSYSDAEY
jgi:hypothetical protein